MTTTSYAAIRQPDKDRRPPVTATAHPTMDDLTAMPDEEVREYLTRAVGRARNLAAAIFADALPAVPPAETEVRVADLQPGDLVLVYEVPPRDREYLGRRGHWVRSRTLYGDRPGGLGPEERPATVRDAYLAGSPGWRLDETMYVVTASTGKSVRAVRLSDRLRATGAYEDQYGTLTTPVERLAAVLGEVRLGESRYRAVYRLGVYVDMQAVMAAHARYPLYEAVVAQVRALVAEDERRYQQSVTSARATRDRLQATVVDVVNGATGLGLLAVDAEQVVGRAWGYRATPALDRIAGYAVTARLAAGEITAERAAAARAALADYAHLLGDAGRAGR